MFGLVRICAMLLSVTDQQKQGFFSYCENSFCSWIYLMLMLLSGITYGIPANIVNFMVLGHTVIIGKLISVPMKSNNVGIWLEWCQFVMYLQ